MVMVNKKYTKTYFTNSMSYEPGGSMTHSHGLFNNLYYQPNPIHHIDTYFFKFYCNIFPPMYALSRTRGLFPVDLSVKILESPLPHPFRLYRWTVQTIKFFIVKTSPPSILIPFRLKYLPYDIIFKYPKTCVPYILIFKFLKWSREDTSSSLKSGQNVHLLCISKLLKVKENKSNKNYMKNYFTIY